MTTTIAADKCREEAPNTTHPVDEVPATSGLVLLALQHVMVMYTGAISVPFVIGAALGLNHQQIAYLIQTIGIWRFCSRVGSMIPNGSSVATAQPPGIRKF